MFPVATHAHQKPCAHEDSEAFCWAPFQAQKILRWTEQWTPALLELTPVTGAFLRFPPRLLDLLRRSFVSPWLCTPWEAGRTLLEQQLYGWWEAYRLLSASVTVTRTVSVKNLSSSQAGKIQLPLWCTHHAHTPLLCKSWASSPVPSSYPLNGDNTHPLLQRSWQSLGHASRLYLNEPTSHFVQ